MLLKKSVEVGMISLSNETSKDSMGRERDPLDSTISRINGLLCSKNLDISRRYGPVFLLCDKVDNPESLYVESIQAIS